MEVRRTVTEGVVCHHPLDPIDPVSSEAVHSTSEEPSTTAGALVVEDLAVREAAVIVDERVNVVEPDAPLAIAPGRTHLAAHSATATAVGGASDLLDVHVHQLAGSITFVAHRSGLGGADHLAGERVLTAHGVTVDLRRFLRPPKRRPA